MVVQAFNATGHYRFEARPYLLTGQIGGPANAVVFATFVTDRATHTG
jgi:hypothetical protein